MQCTRTKVPPVGPQFLIEGIYVCLKSVIETSHLISIICLKVFKLSQKTSTRKRTYVTLELNFIRYETMNFIIIRTLLQNN